MAYGCTASSDRSSQQAMQHAATDHRSHPHAMPASRPVLSPQIPLDLLLLLVQYKVQQLRATARSQQAQTVTRILLGKPTGLDCQ
jgi:hypothetical protein